MKFIINVIRDYLNKYRRWKIESLGNEPLWIKVPRGFWMYIDPTQPMDIAYYLGVYERPMIAIIDRIVDKGHVVIDVGTHKGYVTCNLAQRVGINGLVIAVEADPRVYEIMVDNCNHNHFRCVNHFLCASGDSSGFCKFYLSEDLGDSSRFPNEIAKSKVMAISEVPIRQLDHIADEIGIKNVSFVKIDTEGSEPLVLKGMKKMIELYKPTIFLEVNKGSLFAGNMTPYDIEENLIRFGYSMFKVEKSFFGGARLKKINALSMIDENCFEVLFCCYQSPSWERIKKLIM